MAACAPQMRVPKLRCVCGGGHQAAESAIRVELSKMVDLTDATIHVHTAFKFQRRLRHGRKLKRGRAWAGVWAWAYARGWAWRWARARA
eukprot:6176800-Pleurochrysis_carterae.AAC.1